MIAEMPTFLDVETDDNFYYKFCHEAGGIKTHQQLSMKICEKMMPIVAQMLERAVERGEIGPLRYPDSRFFLRIWPAGHSAGPYGRRRRTGPKD